MRTTLSVSVLPLALALACAASLPAQTQNIVFHPNNAFSGGNAFPWGSAGIRYQTIVPGTLLGSRPQLIQDIFVSGGTAANLEIVYDDIEILMGRTGLAAPTNVWAANNPNPTTVYRGPLRVRFVTNQWLGIGLPNNYLFLPTTSEPNLCFEVIVRAVQGRTAPINFYYPPSSSAQRAFLYNWVNTQGTPLTGTGASTMGILLGNGNFVVAGTGCNSTQNTPLEIGSNTFPQSGKPIDITLTGAGKSRAAILMLGFSFTTFGAIPLPFDLGLFGAPGCQVWNDLLLPLPTATDATGGAKLTLQIPTSVGGRAYMHYWVLDPGANAFNWTTSSYGKLLLGS